MFGRIQTRLFLLLFLLIALCLGALFVLSESERTVVNVLFGNLEKERVRLFDEYTRSRSRNLNVIASLLQDNLSPRMDAFTDSARVKEIAEENNVDGIWLFKSGPDTKTLTLLNNGSVSSSSAAAAIFAARKESPFNEEKLHFFAITSSGICELRGIRVKRSADMIYLFAARLWDSLYIKEIENATLSIIDADTINLKSSASLNVDPSVSEPPQGAISFIRVLKSYNNSPAAVLKIHHDSRVIEEFNHSDSRQFIIFFIFLAAVLAVIFLALLKWVSLPLSAISQSLVKEDPAAISGLKNNRTEFGDVARLVDKFFRQKEELINEITERTNAEGLLKEAHEKLELRVKERTAELAGVNEQLNLEITERKKAGELLARSGEQLRKLSAHLQEVREDERSRIAREIHDELGQVITALKMEVSLISGKLDGPRHQLKEKVAEAIRLIESIFESVQRITYELRPGILDELGLEAAIEWQARELKRGGIDYKISLLNEPVFFTDEQSTAIFRIFQEAVTNIIRHSGAAFVRIDLIMDGNSFHLRLKDDGRGIIEDQINGSSSFGIMGMRERASSLNGSFEISGEQGTEINIVIPLGKENISLKAGDK